MDFPLDGWHSNIFIFLWNSIFLILLSVLIVNEFSRRYPWIGKTHECFPTAAVVKYLIMLTLKIIWPGQCPVIILIYRRILVLLLDLTAAKIIACFVYFEGLISVMVSWKSLKMQVLRIGIYSVRNQNVLIIESEWLLSLDEASSFFLSHQT